MRRNRLAGGVLLAALIVLVAVGLWETGGGVWSDRVAVVRRPRRLMGTACSIAAVVYGRERERAEKALREAEGALREVEARMSTWIADSEISRLNAAAAGEQVPLSPESLHVLRRARQAHRQTGGAMDVTCRGLVELWRRAAERNTLPSESELAEARAASRWELIELTDAGALKRAATARVDLGGIAKGYAVDRAMECLRRAGVEGGLVDVGGDLACFGLAPQGRLWTVHVQNPFGSGWLARLHLPGGAICTSGNYARRLKIAGERYSHIIDPGSGRPADVVASASVLAPTAVLADIWATALSVLGRKGLGRLPENVEALIVLGTKDDNQIICTAGFRDLLDEPLPKNLTVRDSTRK